MIKEAWGHDLPGSGPWLKHLLLQQHSLVKLRLSIAGPPFALMPWLAPFTGAAQQFDNEPSSGSSWSESCPDAFDPLMCSIRLASLVLEAEQPGTRAYTIF